MIQFFCWREVRVLFGRNHDWIFLNFPKTLSYDKWFECVHSHLTRLVISDVAPSCVLRDSSHTTPQLAYTCRLINIKYIENFMQLKKFFFLFRNSVWLIKTFFQEWCIQIHFWLLDAKIPVNTGRLGKCGEWKWNSKNDSLNLTVIFSNLRRWTSSWWNTTLCFASFLHLIDPIMPLIYTLLTLYLFSW